ncbi:hypothetical protein AWB64_06193 [Caballeronia sordidicola]|uniref:Uncharacterized protein n=1 Tax=Caballeronia sordidicola TaxID=196367 RepID=A0A158IHN2_CABSO|nr:hypothetical protein AWB64_06193 [Caballeronia sordidicola]
MRRAFIKQGDQTVAGGWVMEGIEDMEHEGTPLSLSMQKSMALFLSERLTN